MWALIQSAGGKSHGRHRGRPRAGFLEGGGLPDFRAVPQSQPIPLRTRRFQESCRARWASHGDVLRTVAANADSPAGGGLDIVTCRDSAVHTANMAGR